MAEERDPSSADSALGRALDGFLDWADAAHGLDAQDGLPALQGLGPGTLLGDFELVRRLGSGGMGVVFEARQRSVSGRRVAVKVLRDPFASERLQARFRREIATIGNLDHPDVVPIVAAGVEDGVAFYAMKFLDGCSAARLVRELRARVELPPGMDRVRGQVAPSAGARDDSDPESAWESSYARWAARLALHLAEALQHAHERGVVHRDVKPGNVVIRPSGRPVLVDFGLATSPVEQSLTRAGDFLGTLAYAAPEQVRGEPTDARGDVYSLGATLYELLSLRRPFESARRSELLRRIEHDDPPPLGAWVPVDLRTICACALAKDARHRYASAGAMAHDLREHLAGRPIRARPPGPVARATRWLRRHPTLAAAVGSVALLLLGLRGADAVRAGRLLAAGRERLDAAAAELERLDGRTADLLRLRRTGDGDAFFAVEAVEQEIARLRASVADLQREAEGLLEGAFEHVGRHRATRRALADLHATRLERALDDYADLYEPRRVAELEGRLAAYDDGERHAALLARRGSVSIAGPAGARVEVWSGGDAERPSGHVLSGELPFDARLDEGAYLACVTAPGRAPAWLPFVVRRDACYRRPDALPPRELEVHPVAEHELPPGYVHVPAGWTIVEDDPPRWEHVPAFQIRRYEVTYGELLGWAGKLLASGQLAWRALADPSDPRFKPRYGDDAAELHVAPAADGCSLVLRPGENRARCPVRGLAPMEMAAFATSWTLERAGSGWYTDLPSSAEWTRAARGADARRFPWGDDFDWSRCAGHPSDGSVGDEPSPYDVGAFPADVSPFGVHDLAGSVSEATHELRGTLRDAFVCRGGSYRSVDRDPMRTTSSRTVVNKPQHDLGFRLVRRPLPGWMRPDGAATGFREGFEVPGPLPSPWHEVRGGLPPGRAASASPSQRSVRDGALVYVSQAGNYALDAQPWRSIRTPPRGFTLEATLSALGECERGGPHAFGLVLLEREAAPVFLGLQLGLDGRHAFLSYADPWTSLHDRAPVLLDPEDPFHLELAVRPGRVDARAWSSRAPRPCAPSASLAVGAPLVFGLLGLVGPNGIELEVRVDEIALDAGA